MSYEISLSISNEVEELVNKEARTTILKIQRGLTKNTPVGNPNLWVYNHPTRGYIDYVGYFGKPDYVGGRARSNWFAYLGESRSIETTEETKPGKSNQSVTITTTRAKNVKYPTMGVVNNLPYIGRLNDGHSTQAPAKFVEQEIDRVTNARVQ